MLGMMFAVSEFFSFPSFSLPSSSLPSFPHSPGSNIPSPNTIPPIKLKDSDVGYQYVEFPADVFFMESVAVNEVFAPGVAYAPVQRYVNNREEVHLYSFTSTSTVANYVAGPLTAPDGSTDLTIFGSDLSDTGLLYLCAWNRNSILVCDLNTLTCDTEIKNVAAPNDVAVDADVLYVAGGQFLPFFFFWEFSNAAVGQVYKIQLADNNRVDVVVGKLNTLAGVEVSGGTVHVSQLFDMLKVDSPDYSEKTVWDGYDGNGGVWLADNIDVFDTDTLVSPAYTTVPVLQVRKLLSKNLISTVGVFLVQLWTAFVKRENIFDALRDPEVLLSLSNTFIGSDPPEPVRLIFWNQNQGYKHFEIDLEETRQLNPARDVVDRNGQVLGQRNHFNEQVTHAVRLRDKLACVNFEQPRVLLLNDDIFVNALS